MDVGAFMRLHHRINGVHCPQRRRSGGLGQPATRAPRHLICAATTAAAATLSPVGVERGRHRVLERPCVVERTHAGHTFVARLALAGGPCQVTTTTTTTAGRTAMHSPRALA